MSPYKNRNFSFKRAHEGNSQFTQRKCCPYRLLCSVIIVTSPSIAPTSTPPLHHALTPHRRFSAGAVLVQSNWRRYRCAWARARSRQINSNVILISCSHPNPKSCPKRSSSLHFVQIRSHALSVAPLFMSYPPAVLMSLHYCIWISPIHHLSHICHLAHPLPGCTMRVAPPRECRSDDSHADKIASILFSG